MNKKTANNCPPLLTPIEIIRSIAKHMGTKAGNKKIDDLATSLDADYRYIEKTIDEIISSPIKKYISYELANNIKQLCTQSIDNYLSLAGTLNLSGLDRKQSAPILAEQLLPIITQSLPMSNLSSLLLFDFLQLCGSKKPVDDTFKFLDEIEQWSAYTSNLNKDDKDRISAWRRKTDTPSIQQIKLLEDKDSKNTIEKQCWKKIKSSLLIARTLQSIEKSEYLKQIKPVLNHAHNPKQKAVKTRKKLNDEIRKSQSFAMTDHQQYIPAISVIQHSLKRTTRKTENKKKQTRILLNQLQIILSKDSSTKYWVDWHDARWHLFSGDMKKACALYKNAFFGALFRDGENLPQIIQEAQSVAANLPKPDKVFLKQLKNSAITFKYDLPSFYRSHKDPIKNKANEVIQDWEIIALANEFSSIFPIYGNFPETEPKISESKTGPIIIDKTNPIKPDYKNPNKRIRPSKSSQKRYPQIVWFTEQESTNTVKKLLEHGSDVNLCSTANETSILLSIQSLNPTCIPFTKNEKLFSLISSQVHNQETINKITEKRKLLPIICAVETGKPEIVKKVLSMGAQLDKRGTTDNCTALHKCLKLIALLKDKTRFESSQNEIEGRIESIDAIRRYNNGMLGHNLNTVNANIKKSSRNNSYNNTQKALTKEYLQQIKEHLSLSKMRQIARILINSGANPDAEHFFPIKGYTPLMLAAENNEHKLFKLMLNKGGNPDKTYYNHKTDRYINCLDIAKYFHSKEVEQEILVRYQTAH